MLDRTKLLQMRERGQAAAPQAPWDSEGGRACRDLELGTLVHASSWPRPTSTAQLGPTRPRARSARCSTPSEIVAAGGSIVELRVSKLRFRLENAAFPGMNQSFDTPYADVPDTLLTPPIRPTGFSALSMGFRSSVGSASSVDYHPRPGVSPVSHGLALKGFKTRIPA